MKSRVAFALLFVAVGPAAAQEKLATVTYFVGDLASWKYALESDPLPALRPVEVARVPHLAEDFTRDILNLLAQSYPKGAAKFHGKNAAFHMQLWNRKDLDVRADQMTHDQIKTMLEAIRRLLDLSLVVESWLYAVDRDVYDKVLASKMPRLPGNPPVFIDPATEETEKKLLKGKLDEKPFYADLKPLKHAKVVLQNRVPGEVFSWHIAVPYERNPSRIAGRKESALAVMGFSCSMTPTVSADRRMTEIKLTRSAKVLTGWHKVKQVEFQPNQDTKDVAYDVPSLQETSHTNTFTALDGFPIVIPIHWQKAGDERQLLLVTRVQIRIEEEERAIEKMRQEEADKK